MQVLPPAAESAAEALAASPRRSQFVQIDAEGWDRPLRTWIVHPEREDKTPIVIVVQEVFGLTQWIQAVTDRLAGEGFLAIAPDLFSGRGPGGGNTDSVTDRDEAIALARSLKPDEVFRALDAARDYGLGLTSTTAKSAAVGFCWGGAMTFAYATAQPELDAAVVYYGRAPESASLASIRMPVLGLFGEVDERVNPSIIQAEAEMKKLGKDFEFKFYTGAGHAFLRAQQDRDGANMRATEEAWARTLEFLRKHLE